MTNIAVLQTYTTSTQGSHCVVLPHVDFQVVSRYLFMDQ